MSDPIGLRPLLVALRQEQIRVGPAEMLRLRQVFLAEPYLFAGVSDREQIATDEEQERYRCERLRSILGAVLLKRNADRPAFDRVFDDWYREMQSESTDSFLLTLKGKRTGKRTLASRTQKTRSTTTETSIRRRHWLLGGAVAAMLLIGLAILFSPPQKIPTPGPKDGESPATKTTELRPLPERTDYQTWMPEIQIEQVAPDWTGWPALLLGLLALATTVGLWLKLSGRTWLPETRLGPPHPGGPPQHFLRVPDASAFALLDKTQEEGIVWGIGRFVAEEPTRRLDLPATVAATARKGGLPMLRFQHAVRHREIWLWTDSTAQNGQIEHLAAEVAKLLDAYGLHGERAQFRGIPDHLRTTDGQGFGPREVDERRDTALVTILTDGRMLTRHYHADPVRRVRIDALLRLLSHWQHLAWVDFGRGESGLPEILAAHGITVIPPEQLAEYIGSATRAASPTPLGREDQLWAAVCALPPTPVEEADALALMRVLNLDTSPWALSALRAAAPGPGGRLQWTAERHARLLDWLSGLESAAPAAGRSRSNDEPAQETTTLLGAALAFWEERYDRTIGNDDAADRDTAARRRLRAERELLRLWHDPGQAIEALYALAEGSTEKFIRDQVSGIRSVETRGRSPTGGKPNGRPRPCIPMPWRWTALDPRERLMLQELGFGCGGLARERPLRPGRFWLGLGLCAGLAAGALIAAGGKPWESAIGLPEVIHVGAESVDEKDWLNDEGQGRWWLRVTGPDCLIEEPDLTAGARIRVRWAWQERPCTQMLDGGAQLRFCGNLAPAPELPATDRPIHRRLAVLAASPDNPDIIALADALLSGGSADQVLIDPGWPRYRELLTGTQAKLHPEDQLLLLTPPAAAGREAEGWTFADPTQPAAQSSAPRLWLTVGDWTPLAPALKRFEPGETLSAADAWPSLSDAAVVGDAQALMLGGVGGCRPGEWTDERHGIRYAALCGDSFWMGSPESELGRDSDERRHWVTLSPFSLASSETTNAQYRSLHPDHQGDDDLPVADISWSEAQSFCEAVGGSLPTEAQWEYAARAGTNTRWSFGEDETRLGEYAWYAGNSGGKAPPVKTKQPNPWGLYDMHGNLLEWVADWHDDYPGEPQSDPTGPTDGDSRVLRGGAFDVWPGFLRSAFRFGDGPEFQGRYFGFRCARAPRRQP